MENKYEEKMQVDCLPFDWNASLIEDDAGK